MAINETVGVRESAKGPVRIDRIRIGVAAFALGMAVAGPQALGVANADSADADTGSAAASTQRSAGPANSRPASGPRPNGTAAGRARVPERPQAASLARAAQTVPAGRARSALPGIDSAPSADDLVVDVESSPGNAAAASAAVVPSPAAPVSPAPLEALLAPLRRDPGAAVAAAPAAEVPQSLAAAAAAGPDPDGTVTTPYGDLGQWMLQPDGQIADWVGLPYQGKTLLEGINVVFVDSTATSARLSARNLNVWMRRSAFGAWPFSSTGYQGIIGDTTYSQEPTGANEAYRDAFFLLTNSHGRAFGPYPNPSGPGYVWIGAWSKENLDIANLTHGHESFNEARDALLTAMVDKGATNLGYIDMANTYNTADYSTGDSDGMAIVLGLDLPIGVSRPYRSAPPQTAG